VRGVVRVRQLARVRVVVGTAVGAAITVANGHWGAAVVLALMMVSYLALLATQPRVARALLGGAMLTMVLAPAGAQLVTDRGGPAGDHPHRPR
jgi:F0F1-type ATP synthase membrane subunit c/vacuolar-type H+-ATPase subunit K